MNNENNKKFVITEIINKIYIFFLNGGNEKMLNINNLMFTVKKKEKNKTNTGFR